MKWSIINQRLVPADVHGRYRATWKLAETYGKTDVFLGLSTDPIVIMTPVDEHTYRQTTLSHDPEAFRDLWESDRRNELPELRRFLEANNLTK